MAFENINYYVDMPTEMKSEGLAQDRLQILCNVSGSFRLVVLTTLMAVSSVRKTTLMDVLAGRKQGGYIEGNIRIFGFPKKQETFSRILGYSEQNDIHSPNVIVFESLVFSAWLCLSCEVDEKTRMVGQNFSPPCIQCFRMKISFLVNETMQATFTHNFLLLQ